MPVSILVLYDRKNSAIENLARAAASGVELSGADVTLKQTTEATTADLLTADGLLLTNTGSTAARLTAVGPQGMPAWREGALGWVLPGQSKLVELKPGLKASTLSITANGSPATVPAD